MNEFETFLKKAEDFIETESEKAIHALLTEAKALFDAVASNPKVLEALRTAGTIAFSTAVGAAEAGGPGAIAGALEGAMPAVLKAAEVATESAAASFIKAQIQAKIETATAATPTHPNP